MSAEQILLHLLILLVAARVAAEVAERIGQPAVLAEIVMGFLVGPALLGWVEPGEALKFIAELGAIFLLFEVGMHMNLGDLRRVGAGSLRVAAIGIALPMLLGIFVLRAMGVPQIAAIFLAGGITATSVGITARVFGDLRALATVEARTVLGAAVADDVGGLVILAIVVAIGSGDALTAATVVSLLGAALGFVIVATALAVWSAPRLFGWISRSSKTEGTLMVMGLCFALVLARLSSAAHLAPIIGAFIAGLALSGTDAREDLQRRITPLAHFFVPIFFLQIGIETKLAVFGDSSVLALTGALVLVAVAGKIVSGLGVGKGGGDKLLVGVSMIPRGEVGLIFAGLGLTSGILDARYYAVLVAVVLATTLVTPPWVRHLIERTRQKAVARQKSVGEPPQGWLRVTPDEVDLTAEPPDLLVPRIGFEAAVLCASRQPGPWLLQWIASAQAGAVEWDEGLRVRLFELLRRGNQRSWRFLEVTGLLRTHLPMLDAALNQKNRDPFNLDPGGSARWEILEELHALIEQHPGTEFANDVSALQVWESLAIQDLVLLAAVVRSAFEQSEAAAQAGALSEWIGLGESQTEIITFLVAERRLFSAAAQRLDAVSEEVILELASHISNPERAGSLYVLAVVEDAMEPWERERLDEIFNLVLLALSHPELAAGAEQDIFSVRRKEIAQALSHLPEKAVEQHLRAAPRRYLVSTSPESIARHLRMTETPPGKYEVRLEAEAMDEPGDWTVHVALVDRQGILAAIAGAFADHKVRVGDALISTWSDGGAIDVFRVKAAADLDWGAVSESIAAKLRVGQQNGVSLEGVEGSIEIDNQASPWHTIVELRAYDREGLLFRVVSALSKSGFRIHSAAISTTGEMAADIFYITSAKGGKLDEAGERALRMALAGKPQRRWRTSRKMAAKT